jgi:DNA-binding CsgD family transcriptional regulator
VTLLLTAVSLLVAGTTSFVILQILRAVPRLSAIERGVVPVSAFCLMLIPFAGRAVQPVLIIVLIAASSCYLVFHWNVQVEFSYRLHLLPYFHYTKGLRGPLLGIFSGWMIGMATVALAPWMPASQLVACLGIVFLLVLWPAITPYAQNQIVDKITSGLQEPVAEKGSWRTRCDVISSQYALSPRENEVFVLLARGRNSEHISRQLVISVHTAKTHAARIYKKLNVGSQQELLDLVDRR